MNEHPQASLLLQYFDGTLDDADESGIAAHVARCAECRDELARLGAFEQFVAHNLPTDALADADMFAAAEQVIAGAGARRRWWRVLGATVLAAAAACLAVIAWSGAGADAWSCRVVRHRPDDQPRRGESVRFHLELDAPKAVFVAAFVRLDDDSVEELLPGTEPPTAVRGEVRLPANALLDWEFAWPRQPIEVLVITSRRPTQDAGRKRLLERLRASPKGVVPPAAGELGDARMLTVPIE